MPSLQQIFQLAEPPPLSLFAATIIMVSLYRRCSDHAESALHEASHAFWETHYCIDKAISQCRTHLFSQYIGGHGSDEPMSLTLRMNLDAVAVSLHEAALAKVEKDELPASLTTESISKCISAAVDIVEAVSQGQRLTGNSLQKFQQLDQFLVLPITTAIHFCFRMLYHGEGDATPYINCLSVLSSSVRNLIGAENIAPGLLEKADTQVAEAAPLAKRRRVSEKSRAF